MQLQVRQQAPLSTCSMEAQKQLWPPREMWRSTGFAGGRCCLSQSRTVGGLSRDQCVKCPTSLTSRWVQKKNKELQISDNVFSSPLVLKTQTSILGDVLFWSPSGFVLKVTKKTQWEFVLDISQHITIYQLTIFNQRRWQQRKESSALHLGRASVMWMLSLLILLS